MTADEMKTEFLVGYDKVASLAAPGYTDAEISQFLSEAQERFVKLRYRGPGTQYGDGFEETEKRRKDLAEVTRMATPTVSDDQSEIISENSVIFDLPDDFWLTIIEWLDTDDECIATKKVIPTTHDTYLTEKDNPYRQPNDTRALRLDLYGNRHEIITNGEYSINDYKVRYIKQLTDISIEDSVTSELNDMTHREIVDLAVTIALENTQEPRFQSHSALGGQVE